MRCRSTAVSSFPRISSTMACDPPLVVSRIAEAPTMEPGRAETRPGAAGGRRPADELGRSAIGCDETPRALGAAGRSPVASTGPRRSDVTRKDTNATWVPAPYVRADIASGRPIKACTVSSNVERLNGLRRKARQCSGSPSAARHGAHQHHRHAVQPRVLPTIRATS